MAPGDLYVELLVYLVVTGPVSVMVQLENSSDLVNYYWSSVEEEGCLDGRRCPGSAGTWNCKHLLTCYNLGSLSCFQENNQ